MWSVLLHLAEATSLQCQCVVADADASLSLDVNGLLNYIFL